MGGRHLVHALVVIAANGCGSATAGPRIPQTRTPLHDVTASVVDAAHERTYRVVAEARDLTRLTQLYVDGRFVYIGGVTEQPTTPGQANEVGTVRQVRKSDGSVSPLWTGDGSVVALGAVSAGLMFATYSLPERGGSVRLLKAGAQPSTLYTWFAHGSCVSAASDAIHSVVAVTSGSQGPVLEIDPSGMLVSVGRDDCVAAIQLRWPDVYWITGNQLKRRDASGNVTTLFAGTKPLAALAISATKDTYIEDSDGVHLLASDGSSQQDVVSGPADTLSLVAVGGRLFGAKATAGTIVELFTDGTAERTIAADQSHPALLTSDGTTLYWVNGSDRTINAIDVPK